MAGYDHAATVVVGRISLPPKRRSPVPPPPGLPAPSEYAAVLAAIKCRVVSERQRVVLTANAALVMLYWDIGQMILERQEEAGWGARVIDRLSADLREAFPDMRGFSARNLKYMRALAAAWPERVIVQEVLAQLPWYHLLALMEKVRDAEHRLWYARACLRSGWSHQALVLQIRNRAHERCGRAITNFQESMPLAESDMAEQSFKDPYLFDFLGTADLRREREVEQALVDHIQKLLLELGAGFAFVGRQVPLEVGGQEFQLDLLFYHVKLRRYVVIELKAVPFDPAFVGQMNLYLSAVDDLMRHPDDQLTIGLLLCRDRNRIVVEYALRHLRRPIGVAGWEAELAAGLPQDLRASLPSVEELEAELSQSTLPDGGDGT